MLRPGETHVWRMRLPADGIDASDGKPVLISPLENAGTRSRSRHW
jgi:hypothetical protein